MPLHPTLNFGIDLKLFFSTFTLVFIAELPDKTALATMLLAARKHPVAVFLGVAFAFLIQSAVAVSFGSVLSLLPAHWVRAGAGILFLGFAVAMWTKKEPEPEELRLSGSKSAAFLKTAWTSCVVIFLAEWGDLTQLATATLAAKHKNPLTIFFAATLALWSVTAIVVAIGHKTKTILHPHILQQAAAIAFAGAGLALLLRG